MIEYREGQEGDVEVVALLHARSWRASYRGSFTDSFLDGDLPGERRAVWQERLSDPRPDQFVLLALDSGSLEGFICAHGNHDPEWGSFVDNIHVASSAKRRGVGSSLMRQTGAWLARHYADLGVYLWVLEANDSARRFYERLGAHNAGVTTMETHGGAIVRSCRYVWANAETLCTSYEERRGRL
jgi:ribosomal protein S18 acetylase RimI-like enzyme